MATPNLEEILQKPVLEKIASEVKNAMEAALATNSPSISHAWGTCGYAAREVVRRLLAAEVPKNMINVYTFSGGYHTVATIGNNGFKDSWKIDPAADREHAEGNKRKIKSVYAPKDEYWITTPPEPEVVKDEYFWS